MVLLMQNYVIICLNSIYAKDFLGLYSQNIFRLKAFEKKCAQR